MKFSERLSMEQPSVTIWVPDQEIAPEAHDALSRASLSQSTQDSLVRLANEFVLASLDITTTINIDGEDGVPHSRIVLLHGRNPKTNFDAAELLERAKILLGNDTRITHHSVKPNTPETRQAILQEYQIESRASCAFDNALAGVRSVK
jgi:hypothetical protein